MAIHTGSRNKKYHASVNLPLTNAQLTFYSEKDQPSVIHLLICLNGNPEMNMDFEINRSQAIEFAEDIRMAVKRICKSENE